MCAKCEVRDSMLHISAFDWKTLNFLSVQSYIDCGSCWSRQRRKYRWKEGKSGYKRRRRRCCQCWVYVSSSYRSVEGIADGRTILPEFTLANMMNYIVTRNICDGEIAGDFKRVNNHSYRLLYIQLDVIIFETILCQFSICRFCEYIWNRLLFLDRFTVFRGLPRFFLLNKAKLSRNWPWLYAGSRRTRIFCEAFSFKVIFTYPRVLIHWRVCSPYFRAPFG